MLEIGVSKYYVDLLSILNAISSSIHLYTKLNADVCPRQLLLHSILRPQHSMPPPDLHTVTSAKKLGNLRTNTG